MSLDTWRTLSDTLRTVAFFGDSTWEGYGVASHANAPSLLSDLMRQRWGRASVGCYGTWREDGWSFTGNYTEATQADVWDRGIMAETLTNSGLFRLNDSTAVATFTHGGAVIGGPWSSVVLHMVDGPSSGNFSYSIDGGVYANVSQTWSQNNNLKRITVTGPVTSNIRIRGANAAGTTVVTYLVAIEVKLSGETGSAVYNLASSGMNSLVFIRPSSAGDWGEWLDVVQPAVAGYMFTNDAEPAYWNPTTWAAGLQLFVDRVRLNGGEPLLCSFGEQGFRDVDVQAAMRAAVAFCADQNECQTLSFYDDWGPIATAAADGWMQTDTIHPSAKAHHHMAGRIWDLLGPTRADACYYMP